MSQRESIFLSQADFKMQNDYPNDADGDALRGIASAGGDMSKPMVFDFHIAAADEAAAQKVAAAALELGYQTEIYFDDEEQNLGEDPLPPWTCECSKTMLPQYNAIVAAQQELDRIARPLGAYADGWGTYGNAEEEP